MYIPSASPRLAAFSNNAKALLSSIPICPFVASTKILAPTSAFARGWPQRATRIILSRASRKPFGTVATYPPTFVFLELRGRKTVLDPPPQQPELVRACREVVFVVIFCFSYLTGPIAPAIFFSAVSRAVRAEACDILSSSTPPFNFFTNASSTEPPMPRRAAKKSISYFLSTEDCLDTVCVAEKALATRAIAATTATSRRLAVSEQRCVSPVQPVRSHACSPAFFFLAFEFMAYIIPFLRRLGQRTVKTEMSRRIVGVIISTLRRLGRDEFSHNAQYLNQGVTTARAARLNPAIDGGV